MSESVATKTPETQRLAEVKVGAFVLVTIVAALAIIGVLAQKRHMFERRTVIHTIFADVGGLRQGAPVRLSGVNIGIVSRITFAKDRHNSLIHVDLEVSRESLERIGDDSVARIGSQGLLGDKNIEISVSEQVGEPLVAGATIPSQPPTDFNKIIDQASGVLEKAKAVADNAAAILEGVGDAKTLEHVRGIVATIEKLTAAVEKGPGFAHGLFYDPQQAQAFKNLLNGVDHLTSDVDGAVKHLDGILGAVDADGRQLVNNAARAARNIADTAGDLHASHVIAHLDHASGDLAELTTFIKSGHGSIGALIMDPTVYQQLITVLGGVARSRILRALVRYAITKDDGQKIGKVIDAP